MLGDSKLPPIAEHFAGEVCSKSAVLARLDPEPLASPRGQGSTATHPSRPSKKSYDRSI